MAVSDIVNYAVLVWQDMQSETMREVKPSGITKLLRKLISTSV